MTLAPLSNEQKVVVDHLNYTHDHVFVTGKAGAGKTHVLRWFQRLTTKKIVICAPTGIAALNAGGSTIHNLIGLGTGLPADSGIDHFRVMANRKWLRDIDCLVIDEVSMVNSDMLDSVDRMLRKIRQNSLPFGGMQIIMFGDIYQLPPVVSKEDKKYYTSNYRSEWFFDADVWKETEFATYELQNIHRQADPTFIALLNGVRDGSITQREMNILNALGRRTGRSDKGMLLATRRDIVTDYNRKQLAKLKGKRVSYKARVNAGFGRKEPADRELFLKPGARIMMLTNARDDSWVNGSQGHVQACDDETVSVNLDDGTYHIVSRAAWVRAGTPPEDWKLAPKFWQIPMKLSWASTIHKSQGLSLPEIEVDMGTGAFSPGQTYVALSRVTTPEGLFFKRPLSLHDVWVDPNVKRFFDSTK